MSNEDNSSWKSFQILRPFR